MIESLFDALRDETRRRDETFRKGLSWVIQLVPVAQKRYNELELADSSKIVFAFVSIVS